jgi:hypothetical protein
LAVSSDINVSNNSVINNYINLTSLSGNAIVSHNRLAGNATSGDANATADIVNITGDQIDLSGWLGILIINVYGSWEGSLVLQQPVTVAAYIVPVSNSITSNSAPINVRNLDHCRLFVTNFYLSDPTNNSPQTTPKPTVAKITKNGLIDQFATTVPSIKNIAHHGKVNMSFIILGFISAGTLLGGEQIVGRIRR